VVWAVSLSTLDLCTQGLTTGRRIRRCSGLGNGFIHPLLPKRPLPQRLFLIKFRCTTKIVFVENQLSPGSVSFSLLPAVHPMLLQQQRVRSPRLGSFGRRTPSAKASALSFPAVFRGGSGGSGGVTPAGWAAAEAAAVPAGPTITVTEIASLAGTALPGVSGTETPGRAVCRLCHPIQNTGGSRSTGCSLRHPQRDLGMGQLDGLSAAEPGPSLGRMRTVGTVLRNRSPLLRIRTAGGWGALKVHPPIRVGLNPLTIRRRPR